MLLLDINLPDTDGVSLQKRLREIEREKGGSGSDTPILAVSAHVFSEDVESYLAAGFDGFLGKPLVENQLIKMLNRFLSDVYQVKDKNDNMETLNFITEIDEAEEDIDMVLNEKVLLSDLAVLGEERMLKIIDLFRQSAKENVLQLQEAIYQGDGYQVNQLAHKLKGSAGSLGLMQLHTLCHAYEENGKAGDISECSASLLEQAYDDSILAIDHFFSMRK